MEAGKLDLRINRNVVDNARKRKAEASKPAPHLLPVIDIVRPEALGQIAFLAFDNAFLDIQNEEWGEDDHPGSRGGQSEAHHKENEAKINGIAAAGKDPGPD